VELCECASIVELRFGMLSHPEEVRDVRNALKSPLFKSTAVEERMSDYIPEEEWHECQRCHSVWRFVPPDPPFTGIWEQIRPPRASNV
jgi:hypothetical protein